MDDKTDIQIVKMLTYWWYTRQEVCVRWLVALSSFFPLTTELVKAVSCPHTYSIAIFVSCYINLKPHMLAVVLVVCSLVY